MKSRNEINMGAKNDSSNECLNSEKSNLNRAKESKNTVDIFCCQLAPQRAQITLLASPLALLGKLHESLHTLSSLTGSVKEPAVNRQP
eukprot:8618411-Pyramimonas_sp.AAC.1